MESSGNTTTSAPLPAAWREAETMRATLPARSPTVVLICPSAIFIENSIVAQPSSLMAGRGVWRVRECLRSQIATGARLAVVRGEADAAAGRFRVGNGLHKFADGAKHLPKLGVVFFLHLAQPAYQFLTPRGELTQLHECTHDHN